MSQVENVVIIGSGPAACTAAIYAARASLSPVIISGYEEGGQLTTTPEVGNWPGVLGDPSGFDIMQNLINHAKSLNVRMISDMVVSCDFKTDEQIKSLTLSSGDVIQAKAVIIATGASARYLGINSEEQFKGRGISACATCDGFFFRNKTVAVVGGGSVAFIEALYLSSICEKVYIIHRREGFRAEQILVNRVQDLAKEGKIELILNAEIEEYYGEQMLNGIKLDILGEKKDLPLDGVFVAIGHKPATDVFAGQIELDSDGYIVKHEDKGATATSVPGVFAAGDCASHKYHQAIVAAGDGCKAALDTEKYLLGI